MAARDIRGIYLHEKEKAYIIMLITIIFLLTTVSVTNAEEMSELDILNSLGPIRIMLVDHDLKGNFLYCPGDPFVENGHTLAPLRSVAEALDFDVKWYEDDRRVTLVKDNKTIVLWIDQNTALINQQETELAIAPRIVDATTMVPLRFVSESFELYVEWLGFGNTGNIYLSYWELLKYEDCAADDNYISDAELYGGYPQYHLSENGVTSRGIRLGASEQDVWNAYGPPHKIEDQDGLVANIYSGIPQSSTRRGDWLVFIFDAGIVTRVELIK